MHNDILSLCVENNIPAMPGKVVLKELFQECIGVPAKKDFLLFTEHIDEFIKCCMPKLKEYGYIVDVNITEAGRNITVVNPEIFAGNVAGVMSGKKNKLNAEIIIREIIFVENNYRFSADKKTYVFDNYDEMPLKRLEYMGSYVCVAENLKEFYVAIYGGDDSISDAILEYYFFEEGVDATAIINEAKKRGYISSKNKAEYKKYRTWLRTVKAPINKEYQKYQDVLFGLKLK